MSVNLKRLWLQFRLGRLSAVLAIVAIAFFGFYFDWMLKRRNFIADHAYMAYNAKGATHAPIILHIFGEKGISNITISAEAPTIGQLTESDRKLIETARYLFPEAKTICTRHLTGTAYRGEHENVQEVPD